MLTKLITKQIIYVNIKLIRLLEDNYKSFIVLSIFYSVINWWAQYPVQLFYNVIMNGHSDTKLTRS